jgi:hypothetical protein
MARVEYWGFSSEEREEQEWVRVRGVSTVAQQALKVLLV